MGKSFIDQSERFIPTMKTIHKLIFQTFRSNQENQKILLQPNLSCEEQSPNQTRRICLLSASFWIINKLSFDKNIEKISHRQMIDLHEETSNLQK